MPNMFDKYFICDETFRNVKCAGKIIGFQIGVKVSYYRGFFLAVIKDFRVKVDGKNYTRDQITFTLKGETFTFDEMLGDTRHHWDFGEVAILTVRTDGGLTPGEHRVEVYEELRIVNGMHIAQVPFCAQWEKTLLLQEPAAVQEKIQRGISFYSFQDEYYLGKMNVEDCVKAVADMGGTGVEIISEAVIPNFPNPSQTWVDHWFELMEKYHTVPVCYDMFMDGQIWEGQEISEQQAVEIMETNICLAARMGFRYLRVVYTIPLSVIEKCLPCAEKNHVILGIEIHPPFQLCTPRVDSYIEFIQRTGTKNFGIIPDFGIFIRRPVPAMEEKAIRSGAHAEVVSCISDCYEKRVPYAQALEKISEMHPNEADLAWAKQAYSFTYCDPELLSKYIPYIIHIHAKVYDMRNGIDPSVDNETIFRVLKENGWSGWVCTEYEGGRIYHDMADWAIDNVALIREHQNMLRQYIEA